MCVCVCVGGGGGGAGFYPVGDGGGGLHPLPPSTHTQLPLDYLQTVVLPHQSIKALASILAVFFLSLWKWKAIDLVVVTTNSY